MSTDSPGTRTGTWKRIAQALVSLAIVAGIFLGIMPQTADYGDVWQTLKAMTSLELASLFLVGVWHLVT